MIRGLLNRLLAEARESVLFVAGVSAFLVAFTSVGYAQYLIPSESMVPTLEVSDRIVVSKFAYGYSRENLPFDLARFVPSSEKRLLEQMPKRGDVVVFKHSAQNTVLVKRLIGLPGDTIELREGVLYVNGAQTRRDEIGTIRRRAYREGLQFAVRFEETLPGGVRHPIDQSPEGSRADNFGPYIVPARHVFMMGDNRNNSADSRFAELGPVPIENLIGRADLIWVTGHFCAREDTICARRLFKPLAPKS